MQETWIKLYRKLLDSPVFDNPLVLKVWIWALLKANHQEQDVVVGYETIKLYPGEFICGRFTAAERLNIKASTVRSCLATLKKLGNLDIKATNKYSVVKIKNWSTYQEKGQQTDNKVKTKQQQTDTDKNDKNVKNDKKVSVGHFVPPTLEEVKAYCSERGNQVDAQRFVDFYTAKGWMVGKNKMKDWQAAVRTWEKDTKEQPDLKKVQEKKEYDEKFFQQNGFYPLR